MTDQVETYEQRRFRIMQACPSYNDLLGYCTATEADRDQKAEQVALMGGEDRITEQAQAITRLKQENHALDKENQHLKAKIIGLMSHRDDLQEQLTSMNSRLLDHWDAEKKAKAQLSQSEVRYTHLHNQYETLKHDRDACLDDLAGCKDKIKELECAEKKTQVLLDDVVKQCSELEKDLDNARFENLKILAEKQDVMLQWHEMRLKMWQRGMDASLKKIGDTRAATGEKRSPTPDFSSIDECLGMKCPPSPEREPVSKAECPPAPKKPRIHGRVWVAETQEAEREVNEKVLGVVEESPEPQQAVTVSDSIENTSSSSSSEADEDEWSEDVIED